MTKHPRPMRWGIAVLAAIGLLAATVAPADAHRRHGHGPNSGTLSDPIATGLFGPLQMSVARRGDVYVSQDFAGILTHVARDGTKTDVATNPGGEIAGVDVGRHGSVYYTTTNSDATGTTNAASLRVIRHGNDTQVADIYAYEQANNPDQINTYGFESIPADCAAQWPAEAGPTQYTGQLDTHPYAVAASGRHTYIADAAGNAILDVDRHGNVHLVAVLPPQPTVATADALASQGLPACAAGLTYDFEPVPTDVEVGRHGLLYVTTLPGGPEDPSFGARGSVYVVNPWNGHSWRLATGFSGAVNLALGGRGDVYVSELFGGKVSRVSHGGPAPFADVNGPAALESARGKLYVGYDVFTATGDPNPDGKIATIGIGRSHHHHD